MLRKTLGCYWIIVVVVLDSPSLCQVEDATSTPQWYAEFCDLKYTDNLK